MKSRLILILFLVGLILLSGCEMSIQEARNYCAQACEDIDEEKFCDDNLGKVNLGDGSKWGDTTCRDLERGQKIENCQEIICGGIPPPIN